jgi:long-chain acyl-CoA synthetase
MKEEILVIPELFSKAASDFPDKVALQVKDDNQWLKITYKELQEYSLKVAAFLIKEGLKKNDTAAIILENRPEWAIIYLGIMSAGLTCVPIDAQLNPGEINNLIIDSDVKIIFCSYDIFVKKIKENTENGLIKIVVLDMPKSDGENLINFSDIEHILTYANIMPNILPQDIASLIYTSGTTATPKGVLLSHANICSNYKSIAKLNICSSPDNVLAILPLHHTYAFMVTLILPLFFGATVTYCLSLKPSDLSQIIKESGVTVLVGVPQLFSMLHRTIFERINKIHLLFLPFALLLMRFKVRRHWGKKLRLLVSGGARLDPQIARDLSRLLGLKIIEGYGLTETSPVVTLNPPEKIKFGSVGRPIPDVQIKILNPDKSGAGQVLIKGPNVMQGYFKHPEWTKDSIKDGWFYSGDLGFIDDEGYLFLIGRENDIIVLSSGKNIYPDELEEYYSRSPYIKEICILACEEEKFGRLIDTLHAIVVPNLEYFQQKNVINIHAKIRWELENLAKALPGYRHIMGFTLTKEALPRTAMGKIKRYEVREKYLEAMPVLWEIEEPGLSEEDRRILSQDFAQKIIQYLSVQLKKPIYLDSHLEIDLGIDSLTRVELGLGLEALLSLKIPDEVFYDVSTVREVIMRIQEIIGETKPYAAKAIQKSWGEILREKPREEILQKIRIKPRIIDWILAYIFNSMFLFMFRIFWLLRLKAVDNLPKAGPYLICPNHASFLDGFVIASSLPLKLAINTYFVGFSYIFEYPLFKWTLKLARLLPIDPDINLTDAMQAVSFLLSHKKIVCIFPEGLRSVDERVKEFKKGVGILIKELDIPVLPVYIKGSHQSWPRGNRLPRFYPLKVIFGRPLLAQELLERKDYSGDDYEIIARNLREEVIKLAC